jgi:uncharacterized protein (TIGR03435 family)
MRRTITFGSLLFFCHGCAVKDARLPSPTPVLAPVDKVKFEVAAVKMTPPQAYGPYGMRTSPGGIDWTSVPLKIIVGRAYGLKPFQIAGTEPILSVRYDIAARLPSGATEAQVPRMLQSLLEERFGFTFHREERTLAVYELLAPKGRSKLQESVEAPGGTHFQSGAEGRHVTGRVSMKELAKILSNWLDRPMVDLTGIDGVYDVDLKWSGWEYERAAMAGAAGFAAFDGVATSYSVDHPTIFSEVRDKLGLRVQSGKGPVEVLIIDHIEKAPTEN